MPEDPPTIHVFVKVKYQPPRRISLLHLQKMLDHGEVFGDELAWVPGLSNWLPLSDISVKDVLVASQCQRQSEVPRPPPLPSLSSKPPENKEREWEKPQQYDSLPKTGKPTQRHSEYSCVSLDIATTDLNIRPRRFIRVLRSTFVAIIGIVLMGTTGILLRNIIQPDWKADAIAGGIFGAPTLALMYHFMSVPKRHWPKLRQEWFRLQSQYAQVGRNPISDVEKSKARDEIRCKLRTIEQAVSHLEWRKWYTEVRNRE
jgi:hypothetical protein